MDKLETLVQTLEDKMSVASKLNTSVSKAPVGWHIHHCLLMINVITGGLKKSNQADYKWKPNFLRTVVLNLGIFPRGKAKAPSSVQPLTATNANSIDQELSLARLNIVALRSLPKNAYVKHPIFGDINRDPAHKFLLVHTGTTSGSSTIF